MPARAMGARVVTGRVTQAPDDVARGPHGARDDPEVARSGTDGHLCGNRLCCNVAHLEAVTPRGNILRSPDTLASINLAKTHCKSGHPFDEANTYRRRNGGGRACHECGRAAQAAFNRRSTRKKKTDARKATVNIGGESELPTTAVIRHRRKRRLAAQLVPVTLYAEDQGPLPLHHICIFVEATP